MIDLLAKVDKPGVIECSLLLKGKEIVASTFPSAYKNHATIGKQAFSYVFTNVAKMRTKHNESHLEIGDRRISGYQLQPGLILVCLSAKDSNIVLVRNHIREVHTVFLKEQVAKKLAK